ncbi:hypothetical protein P8452_51766 [Trifolium repens]|nr:hypothetical protein P8452_51756 [Trifolium repens]WJX67287.1 hypothetical protein P8452_51766 [Trifolium repens]
MDSFTIPWPCLDPSAKKPCPEITKPTTQKSFAQVVNNVCEIPVSQFPQPCVKGDELAISIPEKDYLAGMEACKHNLHGRIVWPKGATPLTVVALKNKLAPMWKELGRWGVLSLGKGYYEFTFSSLEDVRRVRSIASWSLNPGMLKLFAWSKEFNPRTQQNYSAQVWVRFYGLAQEYWRQNIHFAIASSIGTPICTDAATAKPLFERTFGHFVRVLVDMDLTQTIRHKVLVERQGFAFYVELDYENLPDFCTNCNIIGHHLNNCKRLQSSKENQTIKEHFIARKQTREVKKTFVQTRDGRVDQGTSKDLDAGIVNSDKAQEETEDVIIVEERTSTEIQDKSKFQDNEQILKTPPLVLAQNDDLNQAQVSNKNRFATLAELDIEGEKDKENDQDQNEGVNVATIEDTPNSQDTDFVEDSQPGDTKDSNKSPESSDQAIAINNTVFLKQSWANMMEEDEELEETMALKEPLQPPFTIVQAKASKRSQQKSKSPKKPYGTRSKVGASKPFK